MATQADLYRIDEAEGADTAPAAEIYRADISEGADTAPAAEIYRADVTEAADTAPAALIYRIDVTYAWVEPSGLFSPALEAASARRVDQVIAARNRRFGIQ